MRWFQVESRFRHDHRIKQIRRKFGKEGRDALFLLWGEIADHGARPGVGVHRDGRPLDVREIAKACEMTLRRFKELVDYCAGIGHVEATRWREEGVIVLPAMVRRARGLSESSDEAARKTEQRNRRFQRIAVRDGGAKCCRCQSTDQLELERKVPEDEGGGTEDSNLQIVCVPCGRRRRADRETGHGRVGTKPRPGDERPSIEARTSHDRTTGMDRARSESGPTSAERPRTSGQNVPQNAVPSACTGVVPDPNDRSTDTPPARAEKVDALLPLIGEVRPRVNPALRGQTPRGPLDGTLPRDHLNCYAPDGPCGRVCIPIRIHNDFLRRLGGDDDAAKVARLQAFYREVLAALSPDADVGDDDFGFWRGWFKAKFPSARPTGPSGPVRGAAGRTGAAPDGKYDHLNRTDDSGDQAAKDDQDGAGPSRKAAV